MSTEPYYNHEIVKEEDVPIADLNRFQFKSDRVKKIVLNPKTWDNSLTSALAESIKKNGFIPNYFGKTLHKDIYPYMPLTFVLYLGDDGKYRVPQGLHRFVAARLAGLKSIPCYVNKRKKYSKSQTEEFKAIIDFMERNKGKPGYHDLLQSWDLPGVTWKARDDSERVFKNFQLLSMTYTGRSVLDIACNTGYFAIRAALLGAEYVEGFDLIPQTIDLANRIAEAFQLKCKYKFTPSEFWDYEPPRKFDIIFCNQAIYHFTTKHRSKCLGDQDEVLDRISSWTRLLFLMYTKVDSASPSSDPTEGYYPTSAKLTSDLQKRGFKTIKIVKRPGMMRTHVIASKWAE